MSPRSLLLPVLGVMLWSASPAEARHRCPKPPYSNTVWGLTTAPTSIPSGTTMAVARSSETSGCEDGHPSKDFYRPGRAQIESFLQENLESVQEEAAQGAGPHLQALATLSQCSPVGSQLLQTTMQEQHLRLFPTVPSAAHTAQSYFQLPEQVPALQQACDWSS